MRAIGHFGVSLLIHSILMVGFVVLVTKPLFLSVWFGASLLLILVAVFAAVRSHRLGTAKIGAYAMGAVCVTVTLLILATVVDWSLGIPPGGRRGLHGFMRYLSHFQLRLSVVSFYVLPPLLVIGAVLWGHLAGVRRRKE